MSQVLACVRKAARSRKFVEGREIPLPHWCVIHAPDHHNDPRNSHMHVVFAERPAVRMTHQEMGIECWDFEIVPLAPPMAPAEPKSLIAIPSNEPGRTQNKTLDETPPGTSEPTTPRDPTTPEAKDENPSAKPPPKKRVPTAEEVRQRALLAAKSRGRGR